MKVKLEELESAIAELKARTNDSKFIIEIRDNKLLISCEDTGKNMIEATLYHDGTLGAQFQMTHRLMFMKDKKRV